MLFGVSRMTLWRWRQERRLPYNRAWWGHQLLLSYDLDAILNWAVSTGTPLAMQPQVADGPKPRRSIESSIQTEPY